VSAVTGVPTVDTAKSRRQLAWLNAGVAVLILASAFAVIRSTHSCRAMYEQLQELESSQWYLQEDYGRLLLEHSTWASHYRVEKVAEETLGMQAPGLAQTRVLQR
jgi:cell division protein FtsL